jgi:hypothetical protein
MRATLPQNVNASAQYGSRIAAFAVYLLNVRFFPEHRFASWMVDLPGVKLTAVTIARMSWSCATNPYGFGEAVRDLVAGAGVKH